MAESSLLMLGGKTLVETPAICLRKIVDQLPANKNLHRLRGDTPISPSDPPWPVMPRWPLGGHF